MESKVYVNLTEEALIQLSHSALEAFAIRHLGGKGYKTKYLETCGLLWGRCDETQQDGCKNISFTVSLVGIETSAIRSKNFVEPNEDSLQLKRDLMTRFWPQYTFLGDYHTHPHKRTQNLTHETIEKDNLYNFSSGDINFMIHHNYKIGIVATIIEMERAGTKNRQKDDNLVVLNFRNYRVWLKAYWANELEKDKIEISDRLFLRCPYPRMH